MLIRRGAGDPHPSQCKEGHKMTQPMSARNPLATEDPYSGDAPGGIPEAPSTDPEICPVITVDDNATVSHTLSRALESLGFPVSSFDSAEAALEALSEGNASLMITDLEMPGMDGIELTKAALEEDPDLAVIILTGTATVEAATDALRLGVVDIMEKPIDLNQLATLTRQALNKRSQAIFQRSSHAWLREEVARQTQKIRLQKREVERVTLGVLGSITAAFDARSPFFKEHSNWVSKLSGDIATHLGLAAELVEDIRVGGHLHDIGMMAVSDDLLERSGPLTPVELATIREHCETGARILKPLHLPLPVIQSVMSHHERLDGSGYPEGLVGEAIPLAARVVAVAEAWAAMTSKRAFREALSESEAREKMRKGKGTLYDADSVDALLEALDD